jgi:hypothetical protein
VVTGQGGTQRQVGFDGLSAGSERPGEQSALRVCGGLVRAELAVVDLGLYPGVVLGELREFAAAQQVDPKAPSSCTGYPRPPANAGPALR